MSVINIYVQKIQKIQKILIFSVFWLSLLREIININNSLSVVKLLHFTICTYNTTIKAKSSDGFQIQFESHDEPDARAITGMANFFDYGAMLGGVVAGFLSDQTRGRISVVNISGRHLSV